MGKKRIIKKLEELEKTAETRYEYLFKTSAKIQKSLCRLDHLYKKELIQDCLDNRRFPDFIHPSDVYDACEPASIAAAEAKAAKAKVKEKQR